MKLLPKIKNLKDFKKIPDRQLTELSTEIREFLIELSKQKAIHLSSNLGIVEISMGVLKVFDVPKDKVFYDTGHQSYTHKMLTGRFDKMSTIRDTGGLSGFQSMSESKTDVFSSGHSGNTLSIAQGLIKKNEIDSNFKNYVVPIIGDGALVNGQSFEALNNIAFANSRLIIVVNDNGMSISKSVGSFSKLMAKIKMTHVFYGAEKTVKKVFAGEKETSKIFRWIYNSYNWIEQKIVGKNIFQALGYQYVGPINGNNLKKVISALQKAKWYSENGPVIVHMKTQKGLGLKVAQEDNEGIFHSNSTSGNSDSFGKKANDYLIKQTKKNHLIQIINPAMTIGSGFSEYHKLFPNNYHDVGISEEHAVSMAAGMKLSGLNPIVVIYSTFLQRSYDQIHHDISRLNLPVLFLVDRADLSPGDGATHHGIYDISFLKTIPNVTITACRNYQQLYQLIDLGLSNKTNPFIIRYPRAPYLNYSYSENYQVSIGKWEYLIISQKNHTCIISYGPYVDVIYENIYSKYHVDLINAIFINNYDEAQLKAIFKKYENIILYERINNKNNLFSDFAVYKAVNNLTNTIIPFSYNGYIEHGKLRDLETQQKMGISDLIDVVKKITN